MLPVLCPAHKYPVSSTHWGGATPKLGCTWGLVELGWCLGEWGHVVCRQLQLLLEGSSKQIWCFTGTERKSDHSHSRIREAIQKVDFHVEGLDDTPLQHCSCVGCAQDEVGQVYFRSNCNVLCEPWEFAFLNFIGNAYSECSAVLLNPGVELNSEATQREAPLQFVAYLSFVCSTCWFWSVTGAKMFHVPYCPELSIEIEGGDVC